MALDKRLTKSGNKFFDDSEELAIVVSDEVIEYDSSKISGSGSSELEEKVAGLCEYSTQETDTHKEWIDGKRIYRKVIVLENNTETVPTVQLDNDINIVSMNGWLKGIYSRSYVMPYYDGGSSEKIQFLYDHSEHKILIGLGSNVKDCNIYITIEYTKTE